VLVFASLLQFRFATFYYKPSNPLEFSMNMFRTLIVAAAAALAAACSTAPSQPAAPPPPPAPQLGGNWILTIDSQMGSQDSKMNLTQAGDALTGALEAPPPVGNAAITGKVAGSDVTMSFNVNAQGMELKIDLIGTHENASTMKGRAVFGSFGEGTFSAKKSP
jgi:hypothetical protein